MFLNLTRDVIRSTARFRLRVQTLRFETATWNQSNSSTCDLCDNDDVQDEQHVLFHCANPHVISLRRKHASLFPPTGGHDVFTFLSQNNNKLYSFLHELNAFYEQVTLTLTYDSSVTTRAHVLHLGFLKKLLGVKKGTDTHCARAPRNRPDAHLFLLVQMHHKILEQFTLFKQPSSRKNCAG